MCVAPSDACVSSRGINELLHCGRLHGQDSHSATLRQQSKSPLQQDEEPLGKSNEEKRFDRPELPDPQKCLLPTRRVFGSPAGLFQKRDLPGVRIQATALRLCWTDLRNFSRSMLISSWSVAVRPWGLPG